MGIKVFMYLKFSCIIYFYGDSRNSIGYSGFLLKKNHSQSNK